MAKNKVASPRSLRAWFSQPSHLVLLVGAMASAAVFAAIVALAFNDFRVAMRGNHAHAAMLARILEDQATRTFETTELALDALSSSPAVMSSGTTPPRMEEALRQALAGLTFLRGLAVLDDGGRVVASTFTGDAETFVDIPRLGSGVSAGQTLLGGWVAGRSLQSIRLNGAPVPAPPGVGYIPVQHGFKTEGGDLLSLVALINPDALSNFQRLTLETETFESVVASYAGQVLASSGAAAAMAGQSISRIPVFSQYLPRQEHGTYVGKGVTGERQILGFRVSGTKPLVVMVEESYRSAVDRWLSDSRALLGIGAALTLLTIGLTLAVWRGVRTRESALAEVEAAQRRISQSEHDLSVLMRSVQELIFRTDAHGFITYVNAHWTVFTGEPGANAVGKQMQDFIAPQSKAEVARLLDHQSRETVRHCEALALFPGGRQVMVQVAVVPLRVDGRLSGFAGSAVDVTDRWRAQHQLQAQIAFQELLLETNPLPISVTDAQDRVVRVNRAWEEYKGRAREDVLGHSLQSFLPPEEVRAHVSANSQLVRWGGRTVFEVQVLRGDGSRRDTRVEKAAIADEHGRVTGVLSILMDISEFREAERATQEARDIAEEASRAKSEFVANMSHELRTPLQSILGFAELGVLRGGSQPKLASMFESIHLAGQRMLNLVNDLLEVSRLESTVGTFHLERIDLRGVIRPVLRELDPLLTRSRLLLDVQLADVPLMAKADPLRFEQVIRNVVANAIKFSPPGGKITLTGRLDSKGQVHLVVRDQGPGIPEPELEHIFEAFVQSTKTKDGSGGTGLGLAICRKIVEAMSGQIYARNVDGGGTAFHIVLPARGQAETEPVPLE
jgi:PAS domain S-box-containing protein